MQDYITTKNGINCFYENYKEIETTFPQIEEQITSSVLYLRETPDNKQEVEEFYDSVNGKIYRLENLADGALNDIKHNEDEAIPPLPQDYIDKLTYIKKSAENERVKTRFLIEQARNQYDFYALANGQIAD